MNLPQSPRFPPRTRRHKVTDCGPFLLVDYWLEGILMIEETRHRLIREERARTVSTLVAGQQLEAWLREESP